MIMITKILVKIKGALDCDKVKKIKDNYSIEPLPVTE